MPALCLACRAGDWTLERHRIALLTSRSEPPPRTWIWLCGRCIERWQSGEPLTDQASAGPRPRHVARLTARQREVASLIEIGTAPEPTTMVSAAAE
jgi:hypothetical protein